MLKKYILLLLTYFFVSNAFAKNINFDKIFNNKKGCFILYDLTTDKSVISYGEKQWQK